MLHMGEKEREKQRWALLHFSNKTKFGILFNENTAN